MKKIIFDVHPLATFSLSCEAYAMYYKRKFDKDVYFYTRDSNLRYLRIDDTEEQKNLKNRVITFVDLGEDVEEIPFDEDIRVSPIDETYENDEILKDIVADLGEAASWKNSELKIIEIE
ncbi:Hypothetical protein ING2D1G_0753 [Peptoniphilus sp. ING2-D1G]|nr:Hypothetical protein ING2D1G_0753 [Peptoniphilus sp. ING2-D1G]